MNPHLSLREVAKLGFVSAKDFGTLVRTEDMTHP